MKKLLLVLSIIALSSCVVIKEKKHVKNMHLSNDEIVRFDIKDDYILYDSLVVAYIDDVGGEYFMGEVEMDISLIQLYPNIEITEKLIKFIHVKYPRAKIEVNLDSENIDYN